MATEVVKRRIANTAPRSNGNAPYDPYNPYNNDVTPPHGFPAVPRAGQATSSRPQTLPEDKTVVTRRSVPQAVPANTQVVTRRGGQPSARSQQNNGAHPPTLNSTRRFTMRLGLATGATIVTLLGAQAFALVDELNAQASASSSGQSTVLVVTATPTDVTIPTETQVPTINPVSAALAQALSASATPIATNTTVTKGNTSVASATPRPTATSTSTATATVTKSPTAVPTIAPVVVQPQPVTRSSRR